mgnify:CR=1 FL=1
MKAVTPAWHEATMEVNYARGLDPWFACEAVGSKHGRGHTGETQRRQRNRRVELPTDPRERRPSRLVEWRREVETEPSAPRRESQQVREFVREDNE